MMGALREFVRRLKPKECPMYLDGQHYIFNTIAARVEGILLYTAYTSARRYCTVVQVVHDSA